MGNFWLKTLTPKNTEEIRPGLFVKKRGNNYSQVYPTAWKGKIVWKNLILGPNFTKGLITFIIFMFIVWAYSSDVAEYKEFYEEIYNNPGQFCSEYYRRASPVEASPSFIIPISILRGVNNETKIDYRPSNIPLDV